VRRRSRGRGCILILVGVLLAFLGWQVIAYQTGLGKLPAGITVGGLDVEGKAPDEVLALLEAALNQPVQITYQNQALALAPESVAFQFDPEGTREVLEEAARGRRSLEGFLAYLLRRPPEPVEVLPVATYSPDRLDGQLNLVAQQYDRPPQPPVPLPDTLSFRAGRPGYEMDLETSREQVITALLSAVDRQADLTIRVGEAPPLEMAPLEEMFGILLADFDGIPSLFAKDLQTGAQMEINPDVAYAGMSVLKIAVMVEAYRALDRPPNIEETKLLTETMTLSGNFTANLLLRDIIGNGDGYIGVQNLTESMQYLGLVNTFMATPYDEEVIPPTIVTPANSRTDFNTQPDPYMQTTARDMGLLLTMIYQCSQGGGALMVAYPGAFTAEECQQMLEMMRQNKTESLIETGLPPETPLAHKHGWIGDTHADAGIVFSPGGDFVLVVYLYHPVWLEWEFSNPLISNIATATYNYFNPVQ
jgi:beta-lactamase class A